MFIACKNEQSDSNCGQWKNVGFCTHSHAKFMKDNCAKACGFCGTRNRNNGILRWIIYIILCPPPKVV